MHVAPFPLQWFITGVSGGLGRVLAQAALDRGDRVAGTVRGVDDAEAFNDLAPGRSFAFVADVTHPDAVRAAVDEAIASLGHLDVVVNNAGYGLFGAVEELSDEEVRAQFDANVFGVWNVLRAVLPHLRARRAGHIVQMSSVAGLAASGGGGAYSASKFALEGMSEALAFEVAPFGIAVTLVEPGAFRTAFAGGSARVAARSIDDYASGAAAQRERLAALDGRQPGDPLKAAQAILKAVDAEAPPLRLLLGDDALRRARSKAASIEREADAWEETTRATSFEGTPEASGLPPFEAPVVRRA